MNHLVIIAIVAICVVRLSATPISDLKDTSDSDSDSDSDSYLYLKPLLEGTSPVLWSESTVPVIKSYKIVQLSMLIYDPCTSFDLAFKHHNLTTTKELHGDCIDIWNKRVSSWQNAFVVAAKQNSIYDASFLFYARRNISRVEGRTMLIPGAVYTKCFHADNETERLEERTMLEKKFNEALQKNLFSEKELLIENFRKFSTIVNNSVNTLPGHNVSSPDEYLKIFQEIASDKIDNLGKLFPQSIFEICRNLSMSDCEPSKWQVLDSKFYHMPAEYSVRDLSKFSGPGATEFLFALEFFIPEFATRSKLLNANPFVLYSNQSKKWCEYRYTGPKHRITWNNGTCFDSPAHEQNSQNFWLESKDMSLGCDQEDQLEGESSWKREKCYEKKPEKIIQGKILHDYLHPKEPSYVVYCYGSEFHHKISARSPGKTFDCPQTPFVIPSYMYFDKISIDGKSLQNWFHPKIHSKNITYISPETSKNWVPMTGFLKKLVEEEAGEEFMRGVDPFNEREKTILYYYYYSLSITVVAVVLFIILLVVLLKPYLSFTGAWERLSNFRISHFRSRTSKKENDIMVLYNNNDDDLE